LAISAKPNDIPTAFAGTGGVVNVACAQAELVANYGLDVQ
jgi:hypothetical protein